MVSNSDIAFPWQEPTGLVDHNKLNLYFGDIVINCDIGMSDANSSEGMVGKLGDETVIRYMNSGVVSLVTQELIDSCCILRKHEAPFVKTLRNGDLDIYAIDFDGTLYLNNDFPNVTNIPENWNMDLIECIKELQKDVKNRFVLWTCRTDEELERAVSALHSIGLHFDAINDNIPEIIQSFGCNPRKVVAEYYVDDHGAFLCYEEDKEEN